MYHQILTADAKTNVWQSVRGINIEILDVLEMPNERPKKSNSFTELNERINFRKWVQNSQNAC